MHSFFHASITGHATRDGETFAGDPSKKPFHKVCVAVEGGKFKDKATGEEKTYTTFCDCIYFGTRFPSIKKGDLVLVQCLRAPKARIYQDKAYITYEAGAIFAAGNCQDVQQGDNQEGLPF